MPTDSNAANSVSLTRKCATRNLTVSTALMNITTVASCCFPSRNLFHHNLGNSITEKIDYSISCDQLTIESGELSFSSNQWTYNYEDQSNIIHASYQFGPARKTIALVSAKANHTVWLHFKRFATEKTHFIKVPYIVNFSVF